MFNFRGPSPVITLIPDSRFQAFSFIQHSNRTYASAVNVEVDEEEKVGIIGTRLDMGVHRSGCFLVFFFLVLEECNVHLSPGVFIQMVFCSVFALALSHLCILHLTYSMSTNWELRRGGCSISKNAKMQQKIYEKSNVKKMQYNAKCFWWKKVYSRWGAQPNLYKLGQLLPFMSA